MILDAARKAADHASFEEAHRLIERARALRPDAAEPFFLLGSTLSALGRWAEAIREFQRALFLDRTSVAAELGLGHALFSGQHRKEARRAFERALSLLEGRPDEATVPMMGVTVAVARRFATDWLGDW